MLNKIKELLTKKAPTIAEALQGPAPDEQLLKLEALCCQPLPKGLSDLYKDSNGIDPGAYVNFVYGIPFLPIEECIRQIEKYDDYAKAYTLQFADKGIKKENVLNNKRIPIGNANGDCLLCVDLDPDEGGLVGQVILMDTEQQIAIKLNDSVEQCMASFENDLAENKYSLQEDAFEDGVHWLEPEDDIDPVNWYMSARWEYVKKQSM